MQRAFPDLILGMSALGGSIWLFVIAQRLSERAATFPRVLILAMCLAGLGILIQALLKARGAELMEDKLAADNQPEIAERGILSVVAIPGGLLLVAFAILIAVGFYPASAFLIFSVYCLHVYRAEGLRPSPRIIGVASIFALAMTLAVYLIFSRALGLPAPRGLVF